MQLLSTMLGRNTEKKKLKRKIEKAIQRMENQKQVMAEIKEEYDHLTDDEVEKIDEIIQKNEFTKFCTIGVFLAVLGVILTAASFPLLCGLGFLMFVGGILMLAYFGCIKAVLYIAE